MYEIAKSTPKSDRSPCLTCERKNKDKTRCAPICKRLDAFRRGNDYFGLPIPDDAEIEKPGQPESNLVLCKKCGHHPASEDDGLCSSCRGALKRKGAKKSKAA